MIGCFSKLALKTRSECVTKQKKQKKYKKIYTSSFQRQACIGNWLKGTSRKQAFVNEVLTNHGMSYPFSGSKKASSFV